MSSELWIVILFVLIAFGVIAFQMYVIADQQKRINKLTHLMVEYKTDSRRFRFWLNRCFSEGKGSFRPLTERMYEARTAKDFINAIDIESLI